MDKIINIKKKYKLFLIEDCAQSHGSRYRINIQELLVTLVVLVFIQLKI